MNPKTRSRIINILQLLLVVISGMMAFVQTIPIGDAAPEWLREYAYLWPLVLAAASALQRVVLVLGDFFDDWQINASFRQ